MALPTFTMRQMLEAGVHFGHVTRRWDPKMEQFIFGTRQKIHILDLQQTVPMMYRAMQAVNEAVAGGGRVLWVGTKRQAAQPVAEAAMRCGQYYVNHRWLGGMMTNWKTISNSIRRLKTLEEQLGENNEETTGLTKKEMLKLTREHEKLDRSLGGIKDMGGLPDIVFVLDTNKESIAVAESNKLGIPVIGILDSNSNPDGIDYPIPGNDDSIRAINFYCDMISGSVLSGIQTEMADSGVDLGELEVAPIEDLKGEAAVEDPIKTADVISEAPNIAVEAPLDVSAVVSDLKSVVDVPAQEKEQDATS
jgi:small subunit ribosomal protein S2